MKRKKKILTIIVLATITLIFILPAIGFSILNWGVLPPEKLTPLVIEQANKFIDAHLDCERVELTYFETYPYLGVKLTNGHLISHAAEDSTAHEEELAIPSDSLLAFNRATLSLQPLDYLFGSKITIKDFSIENPRFYGFVNKNGRANWDVYESQAFLDVALHTNAKRIDFKDLELKNVVGEIVLRDQSINLSKLNIQSNMGNGNLTMVYRAKNGQEATAGLDLDMEDVKVEKLIALFPSIDTLVPMLRSFEGVLDCQVTATCKMDSTMSLIMPSINSSCYLHGDNMVLLDGETFTEISKTLMFKNKKRNMIDSISVDLAIKDNKIEVFPFLVEMDRYKVAVGGTHNLDMTFNYHLSVLKSPVPFKLGIDITGNLDDFKYKITKCKYKDIFKPAKQAELDSTRKNIRKDIRDAVRKQIEEAAPELGKADVSDTAVHMAFRRKINDIIELVFGKLSVNARLQILPFTNSQRSPSMSDGSITGVGQQIKTTKTSRSGNQVSFHIYIFNS